MNTGIRTLAAYIDEKSKNIEARQNVTGSYKRQSVVKDLIKQILVEAILTEWEISNIVNYCKAKVYVLEREMIDDWN